jgi:hypothetical protein
MALDTFAFNAERNLAIVAGSAGFALLHLFHGDFFMLYGIGVEFVVAGGALLTGSGHMCFVAEQHFTTFVF